MHGTETSKLLCKINGKTNKQKTKKKTKRKKTTEKPNQKTVDTPLKLVKMFTEACSLHGREPGTKITEKKLVNFQQGNVSA